MVCDSIVIIRASACAYNIITNLILLHTLFSLFYELLFNSLFEFSRKRFSERQAEQWWAANRARVYEQYNVRMVDRSAASAGNDEGSH